nr:ral guanine nucleotide dissociation stimulator-like [Dasypus novemcinctus]
MTVQSRRWSPDQEGLQLPRVCSAPRPCRGLSPQGPSRHPPFQARGLASQVLAQLRFRVEAEDLSPLGPTRPLTGRRSGLGAAGGPGRARLGPGTVSDHTAPSVPPQRKNEGALARGESRTVCTVQAGRWEDLVEHLVPALQEGDLGYVRTFLGTYRVFASTEQVLDRLFHRYGGDLGGKGEPPGCLDVKTTLCALLGTWMDQYWEDFLQPPDSPCLQLLAAHAQEHLPGSGPQCRVALLLARMRHPGPTEAEPEAPVSAPEPPMPPVRLPVPVPPPAADTGPEPESAPSPPGLPAGEVVPAPAVQIEPDALHAGAPAPELQVAPAPPQLPPAEMGPVSSLERDRPTRSAGAPAEEPRAAAAPSGAGAAEPGASLPPPASPPLHGSALPALEGEPAPPAAEAPACELEEASGPPALPPVEGAPVPPTEAEPAPSAGAAPFAPAVGEGEAVPPPPPVPPAQVAPVPTLELQPVQAPSGAAALEGEQSLSAAPEPRPELSSAAGRAAPPQPSCPWPGTCGDGLREQKPELLAFPPKLVAEQLSLMDAELFKKVVPHHCLGSIWSQRHQKGKEHVAPTVRAVISQVNRVADCVMATCLGDPSMKAADKARVVEHWIEVARECRTLRNFSSARAILSGLERHAIGHQKKTWGEVSRDSYHLFQTLSGIVSTEINSSQHSELISQPILQLHSWGDTRTLAHPRAEAGRSGQLLAVAGCGATSAQTRPPAGGTHLSSAPRAHPSLGLRRNGSTSIQRRHPHGQVVGLRGEKEHGRAFPGLRAGEQDGQSIRAAGVHPQGL